MSFISSFPDIQSVMLFALVPLEPDIRFVTVLPAGDQSIIIARIHRIAGANRDIYVDRPLIDIDVFGPKVDVGLVSDAARRIQAHIQSFASKTVLNGVIVHANTIAGPRPLPEPNPAYVRYSATYEVQVHA